MMEILVDLDFVGYTPSALVEPALNLGFHQGEY